MHPLNIDQYSITNFRFMYNEGKTEMPDFVTGTDFAIKEEDENYYKLDLIVITKDLLKPKEGEEKQEFNYVYSFDIRLTGFFHIGNDFDRGDPKPLVYNGGFSILYGAARQAILDITSKQVGPRFILPATQFFLNLKVDGDSKTEELTENPKISTAKRSSKAKKSTSTTPSKTPRKNTSKK